MINIVDSFFNSIYYTGFMPFIALFTLILAIIILVLSFKTKSNIIKGISFILIIFLFLITYHIIPYFYTVKSVFSDNKQDVIENYNIAIKTAVFPIHKGLLSLDYAAVLSRYKMPHEAKSKYEEAYYHLKEYKPSLQWSLAGLFYTNIADYKKAFEIYNFNNNFESITKLFILQNNYNKALEYSNNAVDKTPSAWTYAQRAAIYKNLGKNDLAEQDFNKALLHAKQRNIDIKKLQYLYDNPESYYKEQINLARKNMGLD